MSEAERRDTRVIVGKYRLLRPIAAGGMGEVWAARHVLTEEDLAVKVLFARGTSDAAGAARFKREASLSAKIPHEGVVKVRDAGIDPTDGSAYLVMELLEGESMRERLARPEVTLLAAAEIVLGMLEPLAAAHGIGVVHRDLKPENVFLARRRGAGETVKILDFGIARQLGGTSYTTQGVTMGTAWYMSPEQARNARDVDPAADVWSIGVMLYEALAGEPPFKGNSAFEIVAHVMADPHRPLTQHLPDLDPRISDLVDACLAKEAEKRPADGAALASRLGPLLADPGVKRMLSRTRATSGVRPALASTVPADAPRIDSRPVEPVAVTPPPRPARPPMRIVVMAGLAAALLAGTIAVLAGIGGGDAEPRPDGEGAGPVEETEPVREPPRDRAPAPAAADTRLPPWIQVEPPDARTLLGVSDAELPEGHPAFRPGRGVHAPTAPYEIGEHEVTWEQFEAWHTREKGRAYAVPDWAGATTRRARLPATGVPWELAHDFCRTADPDRPAALPTEEQWEWAARAPDRRPFPWGDDLLDPSRTNAPAAPGAEAPPLWPVMRSDQDRSAAGVADLAGNAQEWTLEAWRDDVSPQPARWVRDEMREGREFRAVRGLPRVASPWSPPPDEPIAFRMSMCARGPCAPETEALLRHVGFRCARAVR